MTTTITKSLKNIYKANQCADLSDVSIALNNLRELPIDWYQEPQVRRRRLSLLKKMETFSTIKL